MLTLLVPCSQIWNEFHMVASEILKLRCFIVSVAMLDISSAQQRTMKLTIAWTKAVVTLLWIISKMYKLQTCYKYEWVNIMSLNICIYKHLSYNTSTFNSNVIFHLQKYSTGFFLWGWGLYIFGMLVMLLGVVCCFLEIPFKWGLKKCHSYFLCSSGRRGETDMSMAWFHHQE